MSLKEWLDKQRLTEHQTSAGEIEQLWSIVERDLGDARAELRGFLVSFNKQHPKPHPWEDFRWRH